jgi:diguanylate cyclase
MLNYTDTTERAAELIRMVIPRLSQVRIPINPINYALWYEYFLGRSIKLNNELDKVSEDGKSPTPIQAERLFRIHILGADADRLDRVGAKIRNMLDRVTNLFEESGEDIEQYSRHLENAKAAMGDSDSDVHGLRAIVRELLRVSNSMLTSNEVLSKQLKSGALEIEQLQRDIEIVRTRALTDPLTGVANRKSFDEGLIKALGEPRGLGRHVGLLMIDVDFFKKVNDDYGHLVGDRVLRYIADTLTESVKGRDIVARYGGEEFGVILRGTTQAGAMAVGEQIREAIESAKLKRGDSDEIMYNFTVSVGVACGQSTCSPNELIETADKALYRCKREGRNRVIYGGEC